MRYLKSWKSGPLLWESEKSPKSDIWDHQNLEIWKIWKSEKSGNLKKVMCSVLFFWYCKNDLCVFCMVLVRYYKNIIYNCFFHFQNSRVSLIKISILFLKMSFFTSTVLIFRFYRSILLFSFSKQSCFLNKNIYFILENVIFH
jgi:hypothetical protein